MAKKKFLIEIDTENKFFKLLEQYSSQRELSNTAAIKQLLFDKLESMEKESLQSRDVSLASKAIEPLEPEPKEDEKPKKNMLKNLDLIKKGD